ncbi:MAG: tetraacyldisaccharide 4'-kinase [Candidatus Omnitrophota bacterium]
MAGISEGARKGIKEYLLLIIAGKKRNVLILALGIVMDFLSLIYSGILHLRLIVYRSGILRTKRYAIKVISVGNITVGGTGKTPLVEMIVEYLLEQKKRVAIISRGYKGIQDSDEFIADEPKMLKNRFPEAQIIINKDRQAGLKSAQDDMGCEVAVLDDAFGNLKTGKDLDIVCIDCLNPFGFGYVLPRGLLRLPLCYLRNAQVFMLTHTDQAPGKVKEIINKLRKYNKKAEIFQSRHAPEFLYDINSAQKREFPYIRDKKVALLCAIAQPELFEKTVASLGAQITENFYFEDHHAFTDEQMQSVMTRCMALKVRSIITTAKDEPRIKAVFKNKHSEIEILVLKIKLEVEKNEGRFLARISALFAD